MEGELDKMKDKTYYITFIDGYTSDYRIPLYAQIFHTRDDAFFFFHALDMPSIYKIYGIKDDEYLYCGVMQVTNHDEERDMRYLRGCWYTREGVMHPYINDDSE